MRAMPWIKLATDLFEDEKIRFLQARPGGERVVLFWVRLLCLAGKAHRDGILRCDTGPYTEAMLATACGCDKRFVCRAVDILLRYGMLRRHEDGFVITHWDEYQDSDAYERRRQADRRRQQAYRQRKAQQGADEYTQFMQKLGAQREEVPDGDAQ